MTKPSLGRRLLAILTAQPPPYSERKPLCTGEQTGWQCEHYWVRAHWSDTYKGTFEGQVVEFNADPEMRRSRACTLQSPTLQLTETVPSVCARYQPSRRRYDPQLEVKSPKELDFRDVKQPESVENLMARAKLGPIPHPPAFAPRDWDLEPGAPEFGWVHLRVAAGRTACGLLITDDRLTSKIVPTGELIVTIIGPQQLTASETVIRRVTCPGCVADIEARPDARKITEQLCADELSHHEEAALLAHSEAVGEREPSCGLTGNIHINPAAGNIHINLNDDEKVDKILQDLNLSKPDP